MDYPVIEVDKIKQVIGDKLLVEWESAQEEMLGGKLVRPDTQRERHYTGIVLKKGIDVSEEAIQEGSRIFFEQFSNFEKFQSYDGKKRYAIVSEGSCLAVIPKRVKVSADDWTQYGEGDK